MSLTKEYIKKIENKNIKRLLLKKENIPLLEDAIEKESSEIVRNYSNTEKAYFNSKMKELKKEEFETFFNEIKQNVDSFLGVSDIPIPEVEYRSYPHGIKYIIWCSLYKSLLRSTAYYRAEDKKIVLIVRNDNIKSLYINELVPRYSHEYTHHIQNLKLDLYGEYNIFEEGHAMGVQRNIDKLYFFTSLLTYTDLIDTYKWLCKKFNLSLNKDPFNGNLLSLLVYYDMMGKKIPRHLDPYALGNTFFYLQEQIHGPKVYSDAIHGKLKLD